MYGDGAQTALAYSMNTEFSRILENEMVVENLMLLLLKLTFQLEYSK